MPICRSTYSNCCRSNWPSGPRKAGSSRVSSGQPIEREPEPHCARLLVEHGARRELREHLLVDAERDRLLTVDALAELLRHGTQLAVIGEPVLVGRNCRAAGGDHGVSPPNPSCSWPEMPQIGEADHQQIRRSALATQVPAAVRSWFKHGHDIRFGAPAGRRSSGRAIAPFRPSVDCFVA